MGRATRSEIMPLKLLLLLLLLLQYSKVSMAGPAWLSSLLFGDDAASSCPAPGRANIGRPKKGDSKLESVMHPLMGGFKPALT